MGSLEPPKPMNFNTKNLADSWRRWERLFRTYYEAAELHKKKGLTQVAILLHCAVEGAADRFDKFHCTEVGQDKTDNIETVLSKFRSLCEPKKNILYDTHLFLQRRQLPGESFGCFINSLRTEAKKCDLGELENCFICMQVVFGHQDQLVRDKLLLDPRITLEKAIDICLDAEASKIRKRTIDSSCVVNTVASSSKPMHRSNRLHNSRQPIDCQYCGQQHARRQCPAYGKVCKKSGKRNYFANVCRSYEPKKMCHVETDSDYPGDEQFLKIGFLSSSTLKSRISEHLIVEDNDSVKYTIAYTLDTGAEVNVLPKTFFDKMRLKLSHANVTLTGFGHNMVQPCGKVELKCFDKTEMCHNLTFYECDTINHAILGERACFDLNLLKRVNSCSDTKFNSPLLFSNICDDYADLFTGYGV